MNCSGWRWKYRFEWIFKIRQFFIQCIRLLYKISWIMLFPNIFLSDLELFELKKGKFDLTFTTEDEVFEILRLIDTLKVVGISKLSGRFSNNRTLIIAKLITELCIFFHSIFCKRLKISKSWYSKGPKAGKVLKNYKQAYFSFTSNIKNGRKTRIWSDKSLSD